MIKFLKQTLLGVFIFSSPTMASHPDLLPVIPVTGHKLDFRDMPKRYVHLQSGWSFSDPQGAWSDGSESKVFFRLTGEPTDLDLMLEGAAFLFGSHLMQQIELYANGSLITTLIYDKLSTHDRQVRIPKATLLQCPNGLAELIFKFKNPRAPAELMVSNDTRKLGLHLRSIMFKQVTPLMIDFSVPFEGVVTLGDCCAPKLQVELYFRARFAGKVKEYTGGGNLFDFMVPYKLGLLADAIGNKLEGCCDKDMRVEVTPWAKNTFTPVDRYQMKFSHLFDGHPIVKGAKYLTQKGFNTHYETDILPKVTYLKKKFITNKNRTLYVMWGRILSSQRDFTEQNIIKVRDALAAMRGDTNFALLVLCDQEYGLKERENIRYRVVTPPKDLFALRPRFAKVMDEYKFVPVRVVEN